MAVIGHAEIVVRAITNNFEKELKGTLSNITKSISVGAGRRIGDGFADGFNRSQAKTTFGQLSDGLKSLVPQADAARERFQSLMRTGYVLQGVLGAVAGAVSSLAVSIGPLIGSLLKAAPAAAALATAFVTLRVAMAVGKTAFGGIFEAVKKSTQQNAGYKKSLKEIREEWQQLLFDAEAAAYGEEEAALNLEKAFENLRRTADLPPNSAARREAELEYKKADLAFRRAKDRTKDLNEVVTDGYDAFKEAQKDKSAGSNPFDGLNKAQTEFAKRLVKLTPKLDAMKLKMSEAFLNPLYSSVDLFEQKLFPILDARLPQIAGQAGQAINQVFSSLDFSRLDRILAEMVEPFEEGGRSNVQLFGDLLQNILDIFTQILDATGPLVNDVLVFLVDKTKEWSDNMKAMDLEGFFKSAGEEAGKWFKILGNVFGGFKNLINLTTGPGSAGEYMLEWFTEASEGFKNMFADDPNAGKQFFKDAMVNARSVLSSIGALIKEILGVADNPNIAATFDKLKEGAPNIGKMLDAFIDAGPSFAGLVVNITRIMAALTDGDQTSSFFDTLSVAAGKFADFLEKTDVQKFLDKIGPIIGVLSGIGVILDVVIFGFNVFIGYLAFAFAKANGLLGPFTKLFGDKPGGGVFGNLAKTLKAGGIVGIIILIVTKIIEFYNKFEDFKTMVDNVMANVGEAFGEFFDQIGILFDNLFGDQGLGGIMTALDPVIKFLLEFFIPIAGYIVEQFVNAFTFIVSVINTFVSPIMAIIKGLVEGIVLLFTDFPKGLGKILTSVVLIFVGIGEIIANIFVDLVNWVLGGIENLVRAVGNTPLGSLIKDITGINLSGVKLIRLEKVSWVKDAMANADKALGIDKGKATQTKANGTPKLALGGTVYPSPGGTLVTVAEAGRPERIEPLNANGLSDRDIAIMQQMGAGSGINITVNPSPGMDEKELAAAVSRQLAFEMRKGTI